MKKLFGIPNFAFFSVCCVVDDSEARNDATFGRESIMKSRSNKWILQRHRNQLRELNYVVGFLSQKGTDATIMLLLIKQQQPCACN